MLTDILKKQAESLVAKAKKKEIKVALAESCTGGMVGAALTAISGSSAVLERGFVTYSNESKIEMLGVAENLIEEFGAVSAEVAAAMARGALGRSRADVALAITGVAGPKSTEKKPVGLVYMAVASNGPLPAELVTRNMQLAAMGHNMEEALNSSDIFVGRYNFKGGRDDVREQSVEEALKLINSAI